MDIKWTDHEFDFGNGRAVGAEFIDSNGKQVCQWFRYMKEGNLIDGGRAEAKESLTDWIGENY